MEQDKLIMAKLAAEADGNIIGNCFIAEPEKDLGQRLGILFGIIEIYNINDTFIDSLIEAINDLKTEYYLPPFNLERGLEKRFEEAVARANRRLKSAVSQSIEEVDLRNLSAVLGVAYGRKIYLTSVGRIKGLFVRRKKNGELLIADILNSSQEKRFRPEPDKIFANILSGELEDRDGLLCLNEEFLGFFSQTDLAEIILANNATETTATLEATLKEKVAKKNFYAIAIKPETEPIAEILAEEETANRLIPANADRLSAGLERDKINAKLKTAQKSPQPQQSIDRLLYTQVKTEKYLNPSSLPNWQKLLIIVWGWLKKTSYRSIILGKETSLAIWDYCKKIKASKFPSTTGQKLIKPENEPAIPKAKPTEKIPATGEEASDEKIIRDENEPLADLISPTVSHDFPDKPAVAINPAKNNEPKVTDRINAFLNGKINEFFNLKKTQQAVIIILTLLVFIFSQSVVMIGRSFETTGGALGYEKIAQQIEDQINSAEAQNIFNDETGALAALQKAEELLAEIPDRRTTKFIRSELRLKIDSLSRELQRISYQAEPKILADFQTAENLIGLAKTDKLFWAFNNQDKTLLKFDALTDRLEIITSSLPSLKKLSALDGKNLIGLTKANEIYKYNISNGETAKTSTGQDRFLIKKYDSLSKLIIPPLASSTIEMSMPNANYLLFLDPEHSRLVVLDKNGGLKRQFVSPILASSTAFASNFTEKKIWVFGSNKVYQLDIDF